jgi:nitrite reductase/ring-hydroxylating ferredoxin subunit
VDDEVLRLDARSLAPGQTATFSIARGGKALPAFVVNHAGAVHAYVNVCPHAGNPLDLRAESLLSPDSQHLVCSVHGAMFAPDTGICVEGPCPGAHLERLAVTRDGGSLVISIPA